MSDKLRESRQRELSALYKRTTRYPLSVCSYCGFPRQCLDHVPPLKIADSVDIQDFRFRGGEFILFPSCLECNALLGAKALCTYQERLHFLYTAYIKRITERSWSRAEMEELGRGLKAFIEARQYINAIRIEKLRGIESRMLEIDHE